MTPPPSAKRDIQARLASNGPTGSNMSFQDLPGSSKILLIVQIYDAFSDALTSSSLTMLWRYPTIKLLRKTRFFLKLELE
jgi:hypothetical protein